MKRHLPRWNGLFWTHCLPSSLTWLPPTYTNGLCPICNTTFTFHNREGFTHAPLKPFIRTPDTPHPYPTNTPTKNQHFLT